MADNITVRDQFGRQQRVPAAAARFFPGHTVLTEAADQPPKKNAATDEWRAYVVEHGYANEEAAASLTRDELIGLVPTTTTEEN